MSTNSESKVPPATSSPEYAPAAARPLAPVVLAIIALSVVAHGISATPLMNRYHRHARSQD
ncbi:hypothetical protein [Burkholderia gladioli]|uniref:hypothetical protein n=1 Tax=Burkholderia gladioli TaxID=28095 RepID=UPI003D1E2F3D